MARFGSLGTQYFDNSGDPLIAGKIYVYEPGTATAKDTYADVEQTILNTNPIILSGAGRQPNVFFSGSARVVLTDRDTVQIEDRDPVGGDVSAVSFPPWNSDAIWGIPDIVVGSDLKFYVSLTDGNTGNDPTSSPAEWTQIRFIRVWNTNETYGIGQIVEGSDGLLYTSKVGSNVGNNPLTATTKWGPATSADVPAVVRAASKTYAYNNF